MKIMQVAKFFSSAICLALLLNFSAQQASAMEVKYGLWAKKGEAQYAGALEFKRVLEAESKGKYTVAVFPGNQLGTPREMLAQLVLGTTHVMASGDPGIKEIEYLALPYLMRSIKNYSAVINSDIGKKFNEKLINTRKVRILGFLPRSPRQISSNVIVNSIDDLKGLKLRAPNRDYYVESLKALGANPTPMAFKEVYTSLQTGVVDGQENPVETIFAQRFYEVQKSIAMVDYITKPAFVMISNGFWSKLSEEERKMFMKAQAASRDLVEKALPDQTVEQLNKMKAAGVKITYPEKEPFIKATQSVRDKLGTSRWGKETYEKIVEIGQKKL